jgi:hypothetical protein
MTTPEPVRKRSPFRSSTTWTEDLRMCWTTSLLTGSGGGSTLGGMVGALAAQPAAQSRPVAAIPAILARLLDM